MLKFLKLRGATAPLNFYNINNKLIVFFIIFVIGCIIYFNSLKEGGFIYDDHVIIVSDPNVKIDNFWLFFKDVLSYGRFIRVITFYFDNKIWGLNPFGYRLTNLLIHIINSYLIYLFFTRLLKNNLTSFFIALFFLIHPINPATVCYTTARKDSLGTLFSILSLINYLSYLESSKLRNIIISFFCFIIAINSKEMFVTVPVIILLINYFLYNDKFKYRYCFIFIFFTVLALIYLYSKNKFTFEERYRYFLIPEYFYYYFRLAFDPLFAKLDYTGLFPYYKSLSEVNLVKTLSYFSFVIGYFIFSMVLIYKEKKGYKICGVMLIIYFISLVPVLHFVYNSEEINEHYLYFPIIFMCGFIAIFISTFFESKSIIYILNFCILLFFGIFTLIRIPIFYNDKSFCEEAVKKNPLSYRANVCYGNELLKEQNFKIAFDYLNIGGNLAQKDFNNSQLARNYYYFALKYLGKGYLMINQLQIAKQYIQEGLLTLPESQERQYFIYYLANIYLREKEGLEKAIELIEKNPTYVHTKNLVYDYLESKKMNKKRIEFLEKFRNNDFFTISKEAILALENKKINEAMKKIELISNFRPTNFYELTDLGVIYFYLGKYDLTWRYLTMALEESPNYWRAKIFLGKLVEVGYLKLK